MLRQLRADYRDFIQIHIILACYKIDKDFTDLAVVLSYSHYIIKKHFFVYV